MALQDDLIEFLWKLQTDYADVMDGLWAAHMAPSIRRLRQARSNLTDKIRATQRAARSFGQREDVFDLTETVVTEAYIVGKLYIAERDRIIRERGKRPKPKKTLRVDVEKAKDIGTSSSKSPLSKVIANTDLTLADQQAVTQLSNTSMVWFRDTSGAVYYDPKAIGAITDNAAKLVAQGRAASEIAPMLADQAEELYGVGKFKGRGRTYWGGVAEHAATTAGVAGQLNELVDLGWSRYEIINPMDERTTPVCQHMNGKTVTVPAGVKEINAVASAKTPGEVKAAKPFVSGGKVDEVNAALGTELKVGAGDLSPKQSAALAQAGFATPPFHFRCRSYVDISFSEGDEIPSLGSSLVPPSALKAPPTPATAAPVTPKPKPLPGAPKPVEKPVTPSPTPEKPLPPGGFPYHLDDCNVIDMRLGGANPKFVIEAPDGSRWMFKDYVALHSPFRAHVDNLAARVQAAAGVEAPETFVLDLPKKWKGWGAGQRARKTSGSVTKLFDPEDLAANDLGGVGLEDLGTLGRADAQVDHAVNWLISNGDAHYENFLVLKNGRVVGIDKAQGFKFFGKDRLAIDYVSPQAPFPSSNGFAYMENQLQRYARGAMGDVELQQVRKVSGELTEFGQRLKAVSDIPDDEYAAIIRPYLEGTKERRAGMFGRGGAYRGKSVDDVLDDILRRKNRLVDDFDDLYRGVEAARRRALGLPKNTVAKPAMDVEPPVKSPFPKHGITDSDVLQEIEESGHRGYWTMSGGGDLESGGMLGYKVLRKGGSGARAAQIQFRGRLNRAAATKVNEIAKKQGLTKMQFVDDLLSESKRRAESVWRDEVLKFAKSYNAHLDEVLGHSVYDGKLPQKTKDLWESTHKKLSRIITTQEGSAVEAKSAARALGFKPTELDVAYAKHYREALEQFKDASGAFKDDALQRLGVKVEPFDVAKFKPTKKAPKKAPPPAKSFRVSRGTENHTFTEHVWVTNDGPELQSEWGTATSRKGVEGINRSVARLNGRTEPLYIFESTKNKAVSMRYITTETSHVMYRGEFRLVIDKAKPTAKDFEDAVELMQDIGIEVKGTPPSLDEMKVLWARKQAWATGAGVDPKYAYYFDDIPTTIPPKEQLEELAEAFDAVAKQTGQKRLKWDELTKDMTDEDFLPVFTQDSTTGGRVRKPHGFPKWRRRDITEEGLKDAGVYGSYSRTADSAESLTKIMVDADNVSMVATSQRVRQGIPMKGMSPVQDMETGGGNFVFTRLRVGEHDYGRLNTDRLEEAIQRGTFDPASDTVKASSGMYFSRKSAMYTDTLFYGRDLYGKVTTDRFISSNMGKTMAPGKPEVNLKQHMTGRSNEMIVRDSLGVQDHIQFWVVETQSERKAAIANLRAAGIDELGGKPIEEVFVVRGYTGFVD